MKVEVAGVLALVALLLLGCEKKSEAPKKEEPQNPASCMRDEDCVREGYICDYARCQKGVRTPEAKAMIEGARKAEAEAAAKKAAEDAPPGPNEGRLLFRVCPFYRKTGQSVARVTAVNAETKAVHTLDLESVMKFSEVRSEFAFRKLPIGTYEVTAEYGVAVGDKRDVAVLKCDKKAKPCKEGTKRIMTVVPAGQEPPPKLGEDGKPEKKPCDWIAE